MGLLNWLCSLGTKKPTTKIPKTKVNKSKDYSRMPLAILEVEHRREREKLELSERNEASTLSFERIWEEEKVNHNYSIRDHINDDRYIEYKIWENKNDFIMHNKHLPNTTLIKGVNSNIIFHGGCLGCTSQEIRGIDRCKGCKYFKADWSKPDRRIK